MATPVAVDRRLPRRLGQLYGGLLLYGISDAMLVLAGLGLDPWDVLHQGLSRTFGLGIGTWTIIIGAAVLLLWIPLRQRPGLGTVSNVFLVGGMVNLVLALVPAPHLMAVRIVVLIAAVGFNGLATALYIGAGLGPGPRDGLMTGLGARGHSIRVVRTIIELSVLVIGFFMGGTVGVGTVLYAVSIGPIAHVLIPKLRVAHSPQDPPNPGTPIALRADSPVVAAESARLDCDVNGSTVNDVDAFSPQLGRIDDGRATLIGVVPRLAKPDQDPAHC
jgi:uncharacterized membrane protein YczE